MSSANPYGMTDCPMPGDWHNGGTVIASGWLRDEIVLVMSVLKPAYPGDGCVYRVEEIPLTETDEGGWYRFYHTFEEFPNIVPAARCWDEYDIWGGG